MSDVKLTGGIRTGPRPPDGASLRWRLVYSGLLSAGMSGLVALIVTMINTGVDKGLPARWLAAWALAFPVAWFAALFWGPLARRAAAWITRPPPGA